MLKRLRNWCRKAKLSPGFASAGGTCGIDPSVRPEARGGCRNSRRCASNVVGFVGEIVTLDVVSLYGTKIVRVPSFDFNPEFLRRRRRPCSCSFRRDCSHRQPPYPLVMIERVSARVASSRVIFEVASNLDLRSSRYLFRRAGIRLSDPRRVDCTAILALTWGLSSGHCTDGHLRFLRVPHARCPTELRRDVPQQSRDKPTTPFRNGCEVVCCGICLLFDVEAVGGYLHLVVLVLSHVQLKMSAGEAERMAAQPSDSNELELVQGQLDLSRSSEDIVQSWTVQSISQLSRFARATMPA